MGKLSSFIAASLAAASLVRGAPVDAAIGQTQAAEMAYRVQKAGTIGDTKSIQAACSGQSCEIANLSGSTGKMPTIKPAGGDATGYKCISKYSPETVKVAEKIHQGSLRQQTVDSVFWLWDSQT